MGHRLIGKYICFGIYLDSIRTWALPSIAMHSLFIAWILGSLYTKWIIPVLGIYLSTAVHKFGLASTGSQKQCSPWSFTQREGAELSDITYQQWDWSPILSISKLGTSWWFSGILCDLATGQWKLSTLLQQNRQDSSTCTHPPLPNWNLGTVVYPPI